jgi:exodeoxyribonuclease VII large subunit
MERILAENAFMVLFHSAPSTFILFKLSSPPMQPTLFSSNHLTVSQLTFRIRKQLESDPTLQDVWVEGEISNLSRPASGHVYFTLKDKNASLRCVMWKTSAARLQVSMREGAAIEAHGKIEVYDPQGQYQLIVNILQPKGEGALYQEFLRLKAMLEAEGLFDMERKRPIPTLPQTIGIITSETGAALHDMLNTLRRRLPLVRVILAPSPVQGTEAPPALVNALRSINKQNPDVILLARGGGSIEDLWAFNDERVVRAVVDSKAAVICGVGHETDFSLCDFAADLRAPTPTAAAELATQVTLIDLQALITSFTSRLFTSSLNLIVEQKTAISALISRIRYVSPQRSIQLDAQRVDDLARRGLYALTHRIRLRSANIDGMSKRLQSLNPEGILSRGYAIITGKEDGIVISKVSQAKGEMKVRVSDGEFEVNRK